MLPEQVGFAGFKAYLVAKQEPWTDENELGV